MVSPAGSEACWITDCGSAGGTHVNRQRVRTRRLRAGDVVQIAVGDRLSLRAAYRSFQLFHRSGRIGETADSDALSARPVTALSYLTVSRPADIALQAFAYSATDAKHFAASDDRSSQETRIAHAWHRRALWTLAAIAVLLPVLSAAILTLQARGTRLPGLLMD